MNGWTLMSENSRLSNFMEHYMNMCEFALDIPKLNEQLKKTQKFEERNLILANIPRKYWKFTIEQIAGDFNSVKNKKNIEDLSIIKGYKEKLDKMKEEGIGLYIQGESGTSKTTLAIIILKQALIQKFRVFFCTSSELIDFVTQGWHNEMFKIRWQYIVDNVDFLVIDNIANECSIDSKEKQFLDKLFTNRSNLNLPTILTSNVKIDDAKNKFGKSLCSLFKESLVTVTLIGKDIRINYEERNRNLIIND